jgi:WD40 repeat protein
LNGKVVSLSLSPDEVELLVGTSSGKIYRVLTADMSVAEIAASHISPVTAVTFGVRSDIFATISAAGSVRVWDLSDYTIVTQAQYLGGEGRSILLTDSEIVTGWSDGSVQAFGSSSGALAWNIARAHRDSVMSLAETPMYIVTGGAEGSVRVWSRTARELLIQFTEHRKPVTTVLVDRAEQHLIHSCGLDRAIFTYDLKRERRVNSHQLSQAMDGAFTSMAQRTDSELELVTSGTDGRMLFWDCDESGPVQAMLDPNRMLLACISMSPSGRHVAVCGEDHQVKVYDVKAEALVACGHGHSAPVVSLQWSPDERQLVSVGKDCCIFSEANPRIFWICKRLWNYG